MGYLTPPEAETVSNSPELLEIPEISISEEGGAQLLSLILKGHDSEWGENDTPIALSTKKYFEENPLDTEISDYLNEIKALQDGGVDEEVLYLLAFTYKHPEKNAEALETITRHKGYVEDPQQLQQGFLKIIEKFDSSFSQSTLAGELQTELETDKRIREENLEKARSEIAELVAFFKPGAKTTKVRKVIVMPTDPLQKVDVGSSFIFGEELIIKSHRENPDNLNHEFLHCVINPIVDKLSQKLTDEQKKQIVDLSSEDLKKHYGEGFYSLLCEELIRTYNDVFRKGERPQTQEDYIGRVRNLNDELIEGLLQNSEAKANCASLGINTAEEFKRRAGEYFDKFEKNRLRDLIYDLYQEYSDPAGAETKETDENFESFIMRRLLTKI